MPASPQNIAWFTSDGVVLTAENLALRSAHPDALDGGRGEREMFYNDPAHAQIVLTALFAILSRVSAVHEGVEIADDLGLGQTVPIVPTVPCFRAIDDRRGIDAIVRTRAFVYEAAGDRYSVEVVE